MTTKQYIGLLTIICVLGSGFAANQWLKFVKAEHACQQQLAEEKQQQAQLAKEKQQQLENAKLMANPSDETLEQAARIAVLQFDKERETEPVRKSWEQFQEDVRGIRLGCNFK